MRRDLAQHPSISKAHFADFLERSADVTETKKCEFSIRIIPVVTAYQNHYFGIKWSKIWIDVEVSGNEYESCVAPLTKTVYTSGDLYPGHFQYNETYTLV